MNRRIYMLFIAGSIALIILSIAVSYISITTMNELREQIAETEKKMTLEDEIEILVTAMIILFCLFFVCPRRSPQHYGI